MTNNNGVGRLLWIHVLKWCSLLFYRLSMLSTYLTLCVVEVGNFTGYNKTIVVTTMLSRFFRVALIFRYTTRGHVCHSLG